MTCWTQKRKSRPLTCQKNSPDIWCVLKPTNNRDFSYSAFKYCCGLQVKKVEIHCFKSSYLCEDFLIGLTTEKSNASPSTSYLWKVPNKAVWRVYKQHSSQMTSVIKANEASNSPPRTKPTKHLIVATQGWKKNQKHKIRAGWPWIGEPSLELH